MRRLDHDAVTRHVAVDPQTLYALVSDVTRTPSWSPQVIESRWLDGATGPEVGARFRARNRQKWFTWSNSPVVTVAEPGRAFAVSRTERGGGTVEWRYDLAPSRDGTDVTLSYQVRETVPLGLHIVLRLLLGVRDLHDDLHANMVESLDRIAVIAKGEVGARS